MTGSIDEVKAEFFETLAHPARIRARVASGWGTGERSVSGLIPDVGREPSHLSQQLGVLRRVNVIHRLVIGLHQPCAHSRSLPSTADLAITTP